MIGGPMPDPFAGHPDWARQAPRPIVPTPATMAGPLRGRRVLIGLPGHGWRGGYLMLGCIQLSLAMLFLFTLRLWAAVPEHALKQSSTGIAGRTCFTCRTT